MTLDDLRARGFASDEQLRATYRRLFGRDPNWIVTGDNWTRQLTYAAVLDALADRKASPLTGVPALGSWHRDPAGET